MKRENEVRCIDSVRELYPKAVFDNVGSDAFHAIFDTVKPNHNANDFPDFLFNGGALEHFEISAGKEDRKGSSFKKEQAKNQREYQKEAAEARKAFMESKWDPYTLRTMVHTHKYADFSYDWFLKSLEKNLESHLRSLSKSKFVGKTVAFLIENQSGQLTIWEGNRSIGSQCIAQDLGILKIFRKAAGKVRYVFYVSANRLECLDLLKIDDLIKSAPSGLDIRIGRVIAPSINIYLDF